MKGQCRVCLTKQMINKDGRMKSHPNKYTAGTCRGSYKLPIAGTEYPFDYPHKESSTDDGCVMVVMGVFVLVGLVAGVGIGFMLWG